MKYRGQVHFPLVQRCLQARPDRKRWQFREEMDLKRMALIAAIAGFSVAAGATTWSEVSVPDPIAPKAKCSVAEPASYGSYIYSWPEKYDQVFWPLTDAHGIWFCEKSGFTAFIGDFDLGDDEKPAIERYLDENYSGESSPGARLALLEGIYGLRQKDDVFRNKLLRVLARHHQDMGQFEESSRLRREALRGMLLALEGELGHQVRLEYLYVAANYQRFFGEVARSDALLVQLDELMAGSKDAEAKGYVDYLRDLVGDTARIVPGDRLDPIPAHDK